MPVFLHLPLLKATDLIGLVTIHDSFANEDISSTLPEETATLKQFFRAQEILEPCGRFGKAERGKWKIVGDIFTLFFIAFHNRPQVGCADGLLQAEMLAEIMV